MGVIRYKQKKENIVKLKQYLKKKILIINKNIKKL